VVEYQIGERVIAALAVPMMQDEIPLIRNQLLTGGAETVLDGVDPCLEPSGEGRRLFAVTVLEVGFPIAGRMGWPPLGS